ncbi:MAG: hypothetical protein HYS22_07275 [Deltaproteobacteria bacterium]|nr:hypothetical protein [Deltaproteobacteria bacterium]
MPRNLFLFLSLVFVLGCSGSDSGSVKGGDKWSAPDEPPSEQLFKGWNLKSKIEETDCSKGFMIENMADGYLGIEKKEDGKCRVIDSTGKDITERGGTVTCGGNVVIIEQKADSLDNSPSPDCKVGMTSKGRLEVSEDCKMTGSFEGSFIVEGCEELTQAGIDYLKDCKMNGTLEGSCGSATDVPSDVPSKVNAKPLPPPNGDDYLPDCKDLPADLTPEMKAQITCKAEDGTIVGPGGIPTPLPPPPPPPPPPAPAFSPIYINAGGAAIANSVWGADNFSQGGSTYTYSGTNATCNALPNQFKTERYGTFNYTFSVPNGTYTVDLAFTELVKTAIGQRKFNVDIQSTRKLTNFDIYSSTGGRCRTSVKRFSGIIVTNGTLFISFTPGSADNPKVSAISILQ